eukprot:scaffold1475_cov147-Isochrysis_galbana.AAC.4
MGEYIGVSVGGGHCSGGVRGVLVVEVGAVFAVAAHARKLGAWSAGGACTEWCTRACHRGCRSMRPLGCE